MNEHGFGHLFISQLITKITLNLTLPTIIILFSSRCISQFCNGCVSITVQQTSEVDGAFNCETGKTSWSKAGKLEQ